MSLGFFLCVALLLSMCSTAKSTGIPDGVLQMECHDRFFKVAVDLSFTGEKPSFEAVDETGVYPITEQYAAKCGYTLSVLPQQGHVELRASYFSCHTDNKDDQVFTFNFNLIVTHGAAVTYAFNKTCSPALPWSPREVTCELNYMEVSVRSAVPCPSGTMTDDWNALKPAHSSNTSDWQVIFQRGEEQLAPMGLYEARKKGYVFDLTDGRIVFRTPYGQPDSISTEVNGVPVEVVHATMFSRQSWVVLMVDLVAACSMDKGSYEKTGYMIWATPEELHPLVSGQHEMRVGVNGEFVEERGYAVERGYTVEKHNNTIQISIPYNAEGAYRKSLLDGDLQEFYMFHLYLEQILVDADNAETRFRIQRILTTPLMPCPVLIETPTVPEGNGFTVYLGNLPADIKLTAVDLNGFEFPVPSMNESYPNITEVVHPNNTHGYTLTVPFDALVVLQQFSREEATLKYTLNINFTLTVMPENEIFYHFTSVEVLFTDASPPVFDAVCLESGISFRLDHRRFDYMWEMSIGSELLTPELVARHGYIMTNDTQSLLLEVPLYTHGYEYKDLSLEGLSATFEISVRERETAEVRNSTGKTCLFATAEAIRCSTDGTMTVVSNLSRAVSSERVPSEAHLMNPYCVPKEADATRALFSFPINTCGSIVRLGKENVSYENEISFRRTQRFGTDPADSCNDIDRVMVKCTYPISGLFRLFAEYKFESDAEGVGSISHTTEPTVAVATPGSSEGVCNTTEPDGEVASPVYSVGVGSIGNTTEPTVAVATPGSSEGVGSIGNTTEPEGPVASPVYSEGVGSIGNTNEPEGPVASPVYSEGVGSIGNTNEPEGPVASPVYSEGVGSTYEPEGAEATPVYSEGVGSIGNTNEPEGAVESPVYSDWGSQAPSPTRMPMPVLQTRLPPTRTRLPPTRSHVRHMPAFHKLPRFRPRTVSDSIKRGLQRYSFSQI